MTTKLLITLVSFILTSYLCIAQPNILDSCGMDNEPVLNHYEIKLLDSLMFAPFHTRKAVIDPKRGFDLAGKKIAFYSCTRNINTKSTGLMTKTEFFQLFKPRFFGHAGRSLVVLSEAQKKQSKGYDAVIVIDCPYDWLDMKKVMAQLARN